VSLRLLKATKDLLPYVKVSKGRTVSGDCCRCTNATDFELEIEDGGHLRTDSDVEREEEQRSEERQTC
jgi:hypothetical protein